MKVIYIAGPYIGKTYSEIDDNIRKAEKVSLELIKRGWCVLTPHKNTAHYEIYDVFLSVDWYAFTIELLSRCDAIFLMEGFGKSEGSQAERCFAEEKGMPVFYETEGYPDPLTDSTIP